MVERAHVMSPHDTWGKGQPGAEHRARRDSCPPCHPAGAAHGGQSKVAWLDRLPCIWWRECPTPRETTSEQRLTPVRRRPECPLLLGWEARTVFSALQQSITLINQITLHTTLRKPYKCDTAKSTFPWEKRLYHRTVRGRLFRSPRCFIAWIDLAS